MERRTQCACQRGRPGRGGRLRGSERRAVEPGFRRRRDGHGALRACGPPAAPAGGVGTDRQLLGALEQRQSVILPAYTAAKAALTSVSKNLSLLLAKDEILVNVVSPGSIASESLVGWAASVGVDGNDPYRLMDAIAEHFGHPAHLPKAGLPHEMGSVVAFLASRRNSYMTGANVNVDGGSDFT